MYDALRAEHSRRFKELWASKSPEERAAWCSAISKGASRRSGGIAVLWHLHAIDAPSRHRRASSAGEEVVGGLFFDFEAVWTDVFTCDLEHISTS